MIIKKLEDIEGRTAGDECTIKEVLQPNSEYLPLRCSLAYATLGKEKKTLPHSLKGTEVYIIIEGRGKVTIGSEVRDLKEGDTVLIPPNAVQSIENTGDSDLRFYCIVDPAWKKEDETVLPDN